MKIIITFLFFLQLIIGGIVGVTSFRAYYVNQLLFSQTAELDLIFENTDQYHDFLTLMADKEIAVSRRIFTDFNRVLIYTTDPTFGGQIRLNDGFWPSPASNEFISNVPHAMPEQVGVIHDTFPDFEIIVRYLDEPRDFGVDGVYQLHTTDYLLLRYIERSLTENTHFVRLYLPPESQGGVVHFLLNGIFNTGTLTGTVLAIFIPLITFACLVATLIQYSMDQLKGSSIAFFHGFSLKKIIIRALSRLTGSLLISIIFAYIGLVSYLFVASFDVFFIHFTVYFIILAVLLMVVYLFIANLALVVILKVFGSYRAIKGYKPDFMIQILNHFLKIVFTICFLIASHFSFVHLNALTIRRNELNHWEVARDVYRVPISHFWFHDIELEALQTERLIQFYDHLSENHHGFLMNSQWIEFYDLTGRTMLGRNGTAQIPFEIDPFGNRVDISLNYLTLNPIIPLNQEPIEYQIIWDDFALNLLVPARFLDDEEEIIALYLEHFYEQSIHFTNAYNPLLGLPTIQATRDDLLINIIYVKDNQYYFTFNPTVRPASGNRIQDPIAVIHTGNFHFTFRSSTKSMGLYFMTDSLQPFSEIESVIAEHDLFYSIRFVYSVFAQNGDVIADLEADVMRSLVIILALILTNIVVSYNLIANYFWRHKYTLFTKRLFGFSLLKRNKWFIISFLGYLIPLTVLMSFILEINVLIIGSVSLFVELIVILVFEHRLQEKSFAEIVKGAH